MSWTLSLNPFLILFVFNSDTEKEATDAARHYFRRLCKWDGHDDAGTRELEVFGHPISKVKEMSQVDIFDNKDDSDSGNLSFASYTSIGICFSSSQVPNPIFFSRICRCNGTRSCS